MPDGGLCELNSLGAVGEFAAHVYPLTFRQPLQLGVEGGEGDGGAVGVADKPATIAAPPDEAKTNSLASGVAGADGDDGR